MKKPVCGLQRYYVPARRRARISLVLLLRLIAHAAAQGVARGRTKPKPTIAAARRDLGARRLFAENYYLFRSISAAGRCTAARLLSFVTLRAAVHTRRACPRSLFNYHSDAPKTTKIYK